MSDTVSFSGSTAEGLSRIGVGDIFPCECCDRMAWVVLVARATEDTAEVFPKGKWATIQAIETQLAECVRYTVAENAAENAKEATP